MIATHPTIGLYAPTSPTGPPRSLQARLPRRLCEVAMLVWHTCPNKEIGAQLGLPPQTIRRYLVRIRDRLELDPSKDLRGQIMRAVVIAWAEDDLDEAA